MNSKGFNQNGLTLIELLVSITILLLIGTLIFTVLIKGKDYSLQAQTTVSLQQEGNRILSELTSWHESHSEYGIVLNQNPEATSISLVLLDSHGIPLEENQEIISTTGFKYSVCYDRNQVDFTSCTTTIKKVDQIVDQKDLPIKILITDNKDSRLTFEIKTIISRM